MNDDSKQGIIALLVLLGIAMTIAGTIVGFVWALSQLYNMYGTGGLAASMFTIGCVLFLFGAIAAEAWGVE